MSTWQILPIADAHLTAWRLDATARFAGQLVSSWHQELEDALSEARTQVDAALDGPQRTSQEFLELRSGHAQATAWLSSSADDVRVVDLAAPGWLDDESRWSLRRALEDHARSSGARRLTLRSTNAYSLVPLDGYERVASQMLREFGGSEPASGGAEIELAPMLPERFVDFRARLIEGYARDTAASGAVNEGVAREQSERQINELLPDGVASSGQNLFVGWSGGREVGILWLGDRPDRRGLRAWVYDVEVAEDLRGRGFGRALMVAGEAHLRERGAYAVGLNVFGFNDVARSLYLHLGYRIVQEQFIITL
jgi:ribosomal protein S18 acetylase RimI-like enzyme